jgi:hypothetical protein
MTENPSVVVALARVMEDVRAVRKGDRNSQQGYNFRGVDAVMNAVGPALRKHGVVVMPVCEEANYRDVTTSTGKPSRECTVKVRYRFYGPNGDHVEAVTPGESMDFGDKGAPKAMSVAYRIALLQALCLPTDDPEPDAATYERAPAQQQSAADAARARLKAVCKENGWDLTTVAGLYDGDLKTETDPNAINAFAKSLFARPDTELQATS